MQPDANAPGSPQEWLRFAEADLALARIALPPGSLYEQLCFHAQQAAEKSLKAVLIHLRLDFPYTHNLRTLVELLPENLREASALVSVGGLSEYAVVSRYPGRPEPVCEDDYRAALRVAEEVVAWALQCLQPPDDA